MTTQQTERLTGARLGFRLQKLEVRNWGTFHNQIWKICPKGQNSLLTGDIGSGKSTLVDALTTLLVPHQRITFNRAAGADGRERSLTSYVLGEYKNVQSEVSGSRRAQYLRNADKDYSVLLASFVDETTGQVISLAQTFWIKEGKVQKFFVVAEGELNIIGDFGNFGSDISKLRKRLRDTPSVVVFDSFSDYAGKFCQWFGISQRDTALDLFFQTVSMKSVGNLTDFVRNQMLGRTNVREHITAMTSAFSDLRQAHETVLKIRNQIERLTVLITEKQQYEQYQTELGHLSQCRDAIPTFLAYLKVDLLRSDLHRHNTQLKTLKHELEELDRQIAEQQREQVRLQVAQQQDKQGQRLAELSRELADLEGLRSKQQEQAQGYAILADRLGLPEVTTATQFFENQQKLPDLLANADQQHLKAGQQRDTLKEKQSGIKRQLDELEAEVKSLEGRRTKIPRENMDLRQRLLDGLSLTEADLPFVGELIQVSDDETDWEGAVERRLRGWGLSLLVSHEHYERFSELVNRRSLRSRLVYHHIPANYIQQRHDISPLRPSLVNKVEIKNNTDFYDWLMDQLLEQHDLVCCESLEEFRREPFAITREGQVKTGRSRHEKDDRFDVHDRSRYILGWSNVEKIKSLRNQVATVRAEYQTFVGQIGDLDTELRQLRKQQDTIRDLQQQFSTFTQLDWPSTVRQIDAKTREKYQLETEADALATLLKQLNAVTENLQKLSERKESRSRETGKMEATVRATANDLYDVFLTLNIASEEVLQALFPGHDEILLDFDTWLALIDEQTIPDDRLTAEVRQSLTELDETTNADLARVKYLANTLPGRVAQKTKAAQNSSDKVQQLLVSLMSRFRADFQTETADLSDQIQDLALYEGYYNRLRDSELARHEGRFRELLQKGTIHNVALFKNHLDAYESEIVEKIMLINDHLRQVNYNTDTYIELTRDKVRGGLAEEIEQFKGDLRACLSDTLGESTYSEAKYQQVRQLLDRFENATDEDQRWTERVTDVRQWYTFGASERSQVDHTEREFYSDSGGKSGGQKEKLAYTVLASAIAYQFGLNENRPRTFRFVMIDEAFGRGSDDSTRHGLELFRQLNIQLLIVTPLQKINIIEHYIKAVHFVSNETGQNSQVRTISKTEYEQEKDRLTKRGPVE
jgi:uncharacterized protein YPO0396